MNTIDTDRAAALAKFLGCEIDEVDAARYGENVYEYGRAEYLVLTDDEADKAARDAIADSLWAFNASFLASETEFDEEIFSAIQPRCEGANDAVRRLIDKSCGLDSFVDAAVSADGRGHFLSGYDGEENEAGEYFIYRVN